MIDGSCHNVEWWGYIAERLCDRWQLARCHCLECWFYIQERICDNYKYHPSEKIRICTFHGGCVTRAVPPPGRIWLVPNRLSDKGADHTERLCDRGIYHLERLCDRGIYHLERLCDGE